MPRRADAQLPAAPETVTSLTAPALAGLRRLSALDTVRARIALAVDLGLLKPGEWLPATDRIAEALEVSEITARRALVALCEDGVLERRRGRRGGTRVADQPAVGVVRETAAYHSASADVHRLIDQRLVLECGIAHLAALRAESRHVVALDDLVARMENAASWAEFHTADERFHLAVAEATGVASAPDHYRVTLHELYRYYLPYPLEYLRASNDEHRRLVAALRGRDPLAAVEVAELHVSVLHTTMFVGLSDRR